MKKGTLFLCTLLFSWTALSQNNVFLDRNYWKQNPSIEDVKVQIEKGNDISELNANAFDPICYALLEKANNETIKYLLSFPGNDVNKITHDKRTYLFWAAYKGNLDMMDYLVKQGAKTDLRDSHGNTVMNFVANSGQLDTKVYDFLIEQGADPSKELTTNGANTLMLLAPYIQDLSLLDYFVSKGVSLKHTDADGNGIFTYAARTVNKKVMEYLIDQDLATLSPTTSGSNAFLFANRGTRSKQNTVQDYQYLESLGINPNVVTKNGVNPLHYLAARSTDINVIQYFLDKGVDVNQTDENENTPFLNAASRNDLAIVQLLFDKVTSINHKNKEGQSALSLAVARNTADIVAFLLKNNANTTITDADGNDLAFYLIQSYRSNRKDDFNQKVRLLEKAGVLLANSQAHQNSLFHLAVDKNDRFLLDWVQSKNIDINAKNEDGLTPLHKAVMTAKDASLIQHLIALGADKNITTDFEESVYDLAQENELLTKNKIDLSFLK